MENTVNSAPIFATVKPIKILKFEECCSVLSLFAGDTTIHINKE